MTTRYYSVSELAMATGHTTSLIHYHLKRSHIEADVIVGSSRGFTPANARSIKRYLDDAAPKPNTNAIDRAEELRASIAKKGK